MLLNSWRRRIGFWLSECATAFVLSLGVLVFLILAVNGFNIEATVLFLDNFSSRFLAASPDLTNGFALGLKLLTLLIAAVILMVRLIDRLSKRRASA